MPWVAGRLAALSLAVVGLVDDLQRSLPEPRLAGQAAVRPHRAGVLWPAGDYGCDSWASSVVVAVVCWCGYVNAFNFMDGINGISALTRARGRRAGTRWVGADHELRLVVLGAGAGGRRARFLPWNAPRARVFLGDVGSYGVGFADRGPGAAARLGETAWRPAVGARWLSTLPTPAGSLVKRAVGGRAAAWRPTASTSTSGWSTAVGPTRRHRPVAAALVAVCLVAAPCATAGAVASPVVVGAAYLALPRLLATRTGRSSR